MSRHPLFAVPLSHGAGDCAIAAIAALTGVDYPRVVATVARRYPRWNPSDGLDVRKIQAVAKALGVPVSWRRRFDPVHTDGLIVVPLHVAVLEAGQVKETDGSLSQHPVETWLAEHAPGGEVGVLVPVLRPARRGRTPRRRRRASRAHSK